MYHRTNIIKAATFVAALVSMSIIVSAQAQNLFVSEMSSGTVTEVAPDRAQSPFASGLDHPEGLAFNSAGDLFVADRDNDIPGDGIIYEYTPS
ncbi:MAG TPA: hypothetical protein VL992_08990, partial [Tepidisphaeraceae bacterium]|nr:hypothetical protein [Tepidisphaeraceae bacterium]